MYKGKWSDVARPVQTYISESLHPDGCVYVETQPPEMMHPLLRPGPQCSDTVITFRHPLV